MLINVELLTEKELKIFSAAQHNVELAKMQLNATMESIGQSHNMITESYMEWRSWVKVDGKYILHYRE